jgi:ABC-type cobalamin transport system permease subunit
MTEHLRQEFGGLWYVRATEIIEVLAGVVAITAGINPARFLMLNIIEESADIPSAIWGITGFAIAMIAMIFIELGDAAFHVVNIIHIIGCALLTFILPMFSFLKIIGKSSPVHFAGSILMIIVGVALIVIAFFGGTVE